MHNINTEAEFNAACISDGEKVLPILRYMQNDLKDKIMSTENEKQRSIIYHKYNNLGEVIKTIENEFFPSAPTFN